MNPRLKILNEAWARRASLLKNRGALRIFQGPEEGKGEPELSRLAIEYFSGSSKSLLGAEGGSLANAGEGLRSSSSRSKKTEAYAWVFSWEQYGKLALSPAVKADLENFFVSIGVKGAVLLERPEKGAPEDASLLFGEVPEHLDVDENGNLFRIRFLGTKHPGLFLDHAPLRDWLMGKANPVRGKSVLNTFAYTGSLSVAAARGGAQKVTTLDLSKPTTLWGKENWDLNFGTRQVNAPEDFTAAPAGDFIFGDVFEWLPKLAKRGQMYDAIILDPPSFSRSPKKVFSTAKDLPGLHALALQLLNPGGLLITSINSAQVTHAQFRAQIDLAAEEEGRKLTVIAPLAAPQESFPGADYLKGWIFRAD